jgi:hypothetical protein
MFTRYLSPPLTPLGLPLVFATVSLILASDVAADVTMEEDE